MLPYARYATVSEGSLLKCSDSMKRSSKFQLIEKAAFEDHLATRFSLLKRLLRKKKRVSDPVARAEHCWNEICYVKVV